MRGLTTRNPVVAFLVIAAIGSLGAAVPSDADCADGCATLQPGVLIDVAGIECTSGPLVVADAGRPMLTTAGHCVPADIEGDTVVGDTARTWSLGEGPDVRDADGRLLGHVTYANLQIGGGEPGHDIALIAPIVRDIDNRMPGWDIEPTSWTAAVDLGDHLVMHGYGNVVSEVSEARDGYVTDARSPYDTMTTIPASPGDSGSAVFTADGVVVGVLTGAGGTEVGQQGPQHVGYSRVVLLVPALERVGQSLGLTLVPMVATSGAG